MDVYIFKLSAFIYLQANYLLLADDIFMPQERKTKKQRRERQACYKLVITISSGDLEFNSS